MERLLESSEEAEHVDLPGTPPHEHPGAVTAPHEHPAGEAAMPHEHPAADEAMPHEHPPGTEAVPHEHPAGAAAAGQEHGGSTPDPPFVNGLLLATFAVAGVLLFSARRSLQSKVSETAQPASNVLDWPVLGGLLRSRHFPTLLIAPTMVVFLFIVAIGLWGEQTSSNPAVLLTWILWWPAVIFSFLLLGRIWCTACPFGIVGDLAQKIFSLQRRVPELLKNMWWRLGLFLALTWATTLWALDRWPFGTAGLGLALTMGAATLGVIYRKRAFCRYVCPVGGIFGLYAMTAPVRIGVKDKQICQQDCDTKDCFKACAWFEFPPSMDRNMDCNLCLDCVRACPSDNITLQAQSIGADLAEFQSHRKSLDEGATVAAVLGVSVLQTVVMLNAWSGWEAKIGEALGIAPGPVLYTIVFLTVGLVLPALLVAAIAYLSSSGTDLRGDVFRSIRTYAYAFLPLGLGLHAAHNFHHLFGEGRAMWGGLKQSLANLTGWVSLAPPETAGPATTIGPNTLFILQWLALVGGLYLAFHVAVALARRTASPTGKAFRAALPILLFAIGYTVLNVLILSAPMAHRH